jgi:hypothetical protein
MTALALAPARTVTAGGSAAWVGFGHKYINRSAQDFSVTEQLISCSVVYQLHARHGEAEVLSYG